MAPNTDKNSTGARLRATLAAVAPGTELREGLERILRGRTGALIVLGHDKAVDAISTGGFEIDVDFTATGLRELSKMDGAIVLDREAHPADPRRRTPDAGPVDRRPRRPAPGTAPPIGSRGRPGSR